MLFSKEESLSDGAKCADGQSVGCMKLGQGARDGFRGIDGVRARGHWTPPSHVDEEMTPGLAVDYLQQVRLVGPMVFIDAAGPQAHFPGTK